MLKMMATPRTVTGPVNVGNPDEFTIRELAELVIALTGSKSRIVMAPLPPDDPRQRQPDITKAKELLGWSPQVRLREGLLKTITFFDEILSGEDKVLDCTMAS